MGSIPKIKWCPIHKEYNYVLVDEYTGKKIESSEETVERIRKRKSLTDSLGGVFKTTGGTFG